MTDSANDDYFSIRKQLRSLDEEQAVALAFQLVDENCSELDARYWKEVIVATGTAPQELTRHYAALGSPAAQLVLGTAQIRGEHTEKDVPQGLFWLRRAHNNGNLKASVMLGSAYLDDTLPRDAQKAAEYISGAAEAGDPVAQYVYAILLIDGDGVAQDEEQAIAWLRRAAERDYEKAIELLQANDIPLREA
jgi:TPR repeat protein